MSHSINNQVPPIPRALLGGISAALADCFTFPIDSIKTRM